MNIILIKPTIQVKSLVIGKFCIPSGLIVKSKLDRKKYDSRKPVIENILSGTCQIDESVAQLVRAASS